MLVPTIPALRIAVLLNSYRSPHIAAIRQSYVNAITAVSPLSHLTFFYPADQVEYPDPGHFDLIVVGGSNSDARKTWPWILRMHTFIRDLVQKWPQKKICGICWGHQTIALVFGGRVEDTAVPELGVTAAWVTPLGRQFFGLEEQNAGELGLVRLQQHHRREVTQTPPGFTELLSDRQCLVNDANTILTFQGHPEKDAATAMRRLADAQRWFGTNLLDEKAVASLQAQMGLEHDGELVWRRILLWAGETASCPVRPPELDETAKL